MLDPTEFGKAMAAIVKDATAPLLKRIEELEARQPEKGDPGPRGEPGKDAEPVLVADIVAELVETDALAPVADLYAAQAVAKHFEAHPVQHGKDGAQGPEGRPGADGAPGRDGLDLKDLFRADGGRLMAVLSDGTTKDLGEYVGKDGADGKDGRDGADGLGFDDCEVEVSDGTVTLKYIRGDKVKAVSYPVPTFQHIGFWGADKSANAGEFTTHDGSLWMAKRATKEAPSYQSPDWQLAARKGADGQRGRDAPPPKPNTPIKLGGGDG